MKRLIGSCLLASLALTIHAQPAEIGLKIAVHIYNYARASPEALVRAERETARIYESAGIAMEWLICPLSPEELARNNTCDVPSPAPKASRSGSFLTRWRSDAQWAAISLASPLCR